MDPKTLKTLSKYLSYHLRHRPEALGLTLEPGGWVTLENLLSASATHSDLPVPLTRDRLQTIVTTNDKQRFSISPDGQRIRANQGHSIPIDLQLTPQTPPAILFHGTAEPALSAIQGSGLHKMARHHVHLSANSDTAKAIGSRHGRPVIFQVAAARMHHDGFSFYCSDNGVWLVDHVPVTYLSLLD